MFSIVENGYFGYNKLDTGYPWGRAMHASLQSYLFYFLNLFLNILFFIASKNALFNEVKNE